jgi:hypothetical protein
LKDAFWLEETGFCQHKLRTSKLYVNVVVQNVKTKLLNFFYLGKELKALAVIKSKQLPHDAFWLE